MLGKSPTRLDEIDEAGRLVLWLRDCLLDRYLARTGYEAQQGGGRAQDTSPQLWLAMHPGWLAAGSSAPAAACTFVPLLVKRG